MSYPDFVSDREGLERWRASAREGSGHDMANANKNTLYRFVQTVDNLETALAESRVQVVDREARLLILEEAFLDKHGCFPLDRTNESECLWNDAMRLARQVSGEDARAREKRLKDVRDAFMLIEMAGVYPGDLDGVLAATACELLGVPYRPPEIAVSNYGEAG